MKKIILTVILLMGMSMSLSAGGKIEEYKKSCDSGSAIKCLFLGTIYSSGKDVKQDYFKAVKFFTKACAAGAAVGCYNIGNMYARGQGVVQNIPKAKELFKRACDGGIADACYNYKVLNKKK